MGYFQSAEIVGGLRILSVRVHSREATASGMSTQSESIRRTARQLQQRVLHLSGAGPPPPATPTPVSAPVPPPVVPVPAEATFSQPAIMAVLQTLSDENEALQQRCHDLNLMRMEVATICCA